MTSLIRRLHIYAGLLSFSHLVVYGIAGLAATAQTQLERPKIPRSVHYVPFTPPPSATDKQVAAEVYRTLQLPLARPIPDWFLRRTPENDLLLDFYNMNGIRRVVVLEKEKRLRIEEIRNPLWLFLEDVHAATPADKEAPALVRIWAAWNELAMWCLIGFCISGLYLWLAARPRFYWGYAACAAGAAAFALLYGLIR
jgi:uncharacterized iron-regulated membrane protein